MSGCWACMLDRLSDSLPDLSDLSFLICEAGEQQGVVDRAENLMGSLSGEPGPGGWQGLK